MKCVLCRGELDENGCCEKSALHWKHTDSESIINSIEELQRRVYLLYQNKEKTNLSSPEK